MDILGLIVGVGILVVGAYKGLNALPLTLFAGMVVILTNGMDVWPAFAQSYMTGYVGFFLAFFLIFASSALFAKIMEETGAAMAVGYKFIDWFGKHRSVLIVFLTTAALTYGGVSLFVVVFALRPIIMILFREANIPRSMAIGPLVAGSATFTMKSLPGSPQLTNVVPTGFFGTTLTAAPMLGIISAIMMLVLQIFYFRYEERKSRERGETFSFMEGQNEELYKVDRDKLPSPIVSFLPLIVVVTMIIGLRTVVTPAAQLVVISMLVASTLAIILNWKRIPNLKNIINIGSGGAITAIAGPASVVGFGAIVQATPAFQTIVQGLLGMEMSPYALAALAPSILAGITGSSSGGLNISLQVLADHLIASGANLDLLHRISAMFAGTLDTLPHSPGLFLMFPYLGLSHKDGYRYVFWSAVVIPTFVGLICLAAVIAMAG
ncbi:MAG: GntP family permease [Spirochaetes bacterium]|nr:GntP family permease [Spirochaetota bacterium]